MKSNNLIKTVTGALVFMAILGFAFYLIVLSLFRALGIDGESTVAVFIAIAIFLLLGYLGWTVAKNLFK